MTLRVSDMIILSLQAMVPDIQSVKNSAFLKSLSRLIRARTLPVFCCRWTSCHSERSCYSEHPSLYWLTWAESSQGELIVYQWSVVPPSSSVVVRRRPHFQTWISLKPVGQSWSNSMCSITGVKERLHKVLGQIGSKLWFPWQQKAPIDL